MSHPHLRSLPSLLLFAILALSACAPAPIAALALTPTPSASPSATPAPPTITPSPTPTETATPPPTYTPTPTETPTAPATATPEKTATPTPTLTAAERVREIERLSKGSYDFGNGSFVATANGILIPTDGRNGFSPAKFNQANDMKKWINWAIASSPKLRQLFSDVPVAMIIDFTDILKSRGHGSAPGLVGSPGNYQFIVLLNAEVYETDIYGPPGAKRGMTLMQIGHEMARRYAEITKGSSSKKNVWLPWEKEFLDALLLILPDEAERQRVQAFYDSDANLPS